MLDELLDPPEIELVTPDAGSPLPDQLLRLGLGLALELCFFLEVGTKHGGDRRHDLGFGSRDLEEVSPEQVLYELRCDAVDLRRRGPHERSASRPQSSAQARVDRSASLPLGRVHLPGVQVGRPDRIRPGDTVGVVAPAGVVDAERLERGVRVLEGLGFRVVTGEGVLERHAYLAGTDRVRCRDLEEMLADPDVRLLVAARGGFGCARVLPYLQRILRQRPPKPLVGFSDVSALLAAWVEAGGLGIHGPMVAADLAAGLSEASVEHFRRLLADPDYRWTAPAPVTIRPGRARGPLVGGCLSVLTTLIGTPWMPDTRGAILLLEDVSEPPYRLDRLLTHLRNAGVLDGPAGVLFGTMEGCPVQEGVGALDVVREAFADAPYPVGFGAPVGHRSRETEIEHLALPLGPAVELDTEAGVLRALEPAVL